MVLSAKLYNPVNIENNIYTFDSMKDRFGFADVT